MKNKKGQIETTTQETPKKSRRWLWILIILILLGIGVGIYFWLFKGSSILHPPAFPE